MKEFKGSDSLYTEKYRPQNIDDCILPDGAKKTFEEYVKRGEIQNLLFCGSAGVGKTTVGLALGRALGADTLVINASEESGIDVLRTKIRDFASTMSLQDTKKIVILDEADYLTPMSQGGLRRFMEEFSANCRFIFTCNFKNKIIEPLHSRCTVVDFRISKKDIPSIAMQFMKRAEFILTNEGVPYNKKVLVEVIQHYFPDFRRTLNELQRYAVMGEIDEGILACLTDNTIKELIAALKEKNFTNMRKWVAQHGDNEPTLIFRTIYNGLNENLKPESIPAAILILNDYAHKACFVPDHQLNTTACFIELMSECEFK